jgi:hypothetical protein
MMMTTLRHTLMMLMHHLRRYAGCVAISLRTLEICQMNGCACFHGNSLYTFCKQPQIQLQAARQNIAMQSRVAY